MRRIPVGMGGGCLSPSSVSGSQEDGVVGVPTECPVSPGVCSVVHMVRAGVRGGGGRSIGGGAAGGSSAVVTGISILKRVGGGLVTVLFL